MFEASNGKMHLIPIINLPDIVVLSCPLAACFLFLFFIVILFSFLHRFIFLHRFFFSIFPLINSYFPWYVIKQSGENASGTLITRP